VWTIGSPLFVVWQAPPKPEKSWLVETGPNQLANRWVVTQFAFPNGTGSGPYEQCVAVSQTGDATGAYYRYEFVISQTEFDDYPSSGSGPTRTTSPSTTSSSAGRSTARPSSHSTAPR
jgi:hypothetical protein